MNTQATATSHAAAVTTRRTTVLRTLRELRLDRGWTLTCRHAGCPRYVDLSVMPRG